MVKALGGWVGCSGLHFSMRKRLLVLKLSVETDEHGQVRSLSGGWMYRNVLNGVSETLDVAGDDNYVGAFLCEQTADTAAHALGPAGDEDGLASPRVSRGIGAREAGVKAHLAIDGEVVFAGECTHCNEGQGCNGDKRENIYPHPIMDVQLTSACSPSGVLISKEAAPGQSAISPNKLAKVLSAALTYR